MSTTNYSSLALVNYKLRRTFNKCVKGNDNQLQVKKTGKSFDSSYITAFKKCVAINKPNVKCEEIIVEPEDKLFINFDDFNPKPISDSVNGTIQGGWSGGAQTYFQNDSTDDERIVSDKYHSSPQSWYINSTLYNNPGQGSPFTPALNIETNSVDETAFNESIKGKTFHYSLWFYGETTGIGSRTIIYNGSYQGNDRTGFNINIEKLAEGIRIFSYSYIASPESFPQIDLETGLAYDTWHNVKIDITYAADGDPANDVFTYTINNGIPKQVPSWINLWRKAYSFPLSYGTRLAFATSGNPQGIYFDDLLLELDTTSVCNSCCCNYISPPPAPTSAPEDGLFAFATLTQQIDHRVDEQLSKINNNTNAPDDLKFFPPEPET